MDDLTEGSRSEEGFCDEGSAGEAADGGEVFKGED